RYIEDKLRLVTEARPRTAVLNAADPRLAALELPGSRIIWFNREDGWHLRDDALYRGDDFVFDTAAVPLPGRHNRGNLCAVLAAMDFRPLPHRLQWLGERDGIGYVNDSISTTPHASLAALDCHRGSPVAILLGGHDRGLDWHGFAERLRAQPPKAVVTMGANG